MRYRRLAISLGCLAAAVALCAVGYRSYLVHQLHKPVLAQLSDPDAAVFRNERLISWRPPTLCGQVNTKNTFGGYVGFRNFMAFDGSATIETDLDEGRRIVEEKEFCS